MSSKSSVSLGCLEMGSEMDIWVQGVLGGMPFRVNICK